MKLDRIFLSSPHIEGNELHYIKKAFDSNFIAPLGPMNDAFEQALSKYTGIPYCLVLNSGTSALHLALKHLNVQSGDVVIASSFTFIASVSNAYHMGAELRFVDCDPETWNIDPVLLQQALDECKKEGRLPKVVIPTDLYGQCADYDAIKAVCDPVGVNVLIDSAEALGAYYKGRHAGFDGHVCALSFNGNKIITTSGGGALLSHDQNFITHARQLSTQARENTPYYEHKEVGFNYRMSNICAAIGLGQLEFLPQKLQRRKEIFYLYQEYLAPIKEHISFMPLATYGMPNFWLTVITINDTNKTTPEKLRIALEKKNIESRPAWKPMHLQPVFERNKVYGGHVSHSIFERALCLPSGSALTNSQMEFVCDILCKEFA